MKRTISADIFIVQARTLLTAGTAVWFLLAVTVCLLPFVPDEKLVRLKLQWFEMGVFAAFSLWSPGKTVKVQCDACAMFSPEMFRRFVVPALTEQCEWLDHSMYHLDGTQCIDKLDHLLAIESLDAIEWTPQSGTERGGNPRWFELYQRILAGGKSLQAIGVRLDELRSLLDTIGPKGVYIMVAAQTPEEAEKALTIAEEYR